MTCSFKCYKPYNTINAASMVCVNMFKFVVFALVAIQLLAGIHFYIYPKMKLIMHISLYKIINIIIINIIIIIIIIIISINIITITRSQHVTIFFFTICFMIHEL